MIFGALLFVYSGLYNIGTDDHHIKPVHALLQTLRDRSIEFRAKNIVVPNLEDRELILKGAGQYSAMCTGCHLSPGVENSEIRVGLYPIPPNLSQMAMDPTVAFWVIKHGIKMSAMPAWGGSHDDATIWSMVAFLQKLPTMSSEKYKEIVALAPPDDDMDMGHGDVSDSSHHEH
ncbi:MAG: c-type cytochrome [Parvibaculaceae bacterium]